MRKPRLNFLGFIFLAGCASASRECSGCNANNFGADWIVVQYRMDGEPINCWQLHGKAIANEQSSDGIWWVADGGHLVHISGHYNRVQVTNSGFETAAKEIGIDLKRCVGGRYEPAK